MSDLLYSDIEESLRSSVRGVLARSLQTDEIAKFYDDTNADASDTWRALAQDLGVAGLLIPESRGGAGASAREAAVVLEELGRSVAPVPFLTSSVIATTVLLSAGETSAITELASGKSRCALVLPWSARPGKWTAVEGESVGLVAGAVDADIFLAPVMHQGRLELRLHQTATTERLTSLDMSRPLAAVAVSGPGTTIAADDEARAAIDAGLSVGAALLASEQVGIAQWCLDTTLEYVKTRIQFARPIGSFQAIKHRLADLYLAVTQAQAAARHAADTIATGDPDASVARAVAKSYCSDVAVQAAEEALQLHGGIGMTWEHPVHLYLKRAKANQLALGTPAVHRRELAELINLPPH